MQGAWSSTNRAECPTDRGPGPGREWRLARSTTRSADQALAAAQISRPGSPTRTRPASLNSPRSLKVVAAAASTTPACSRPASSMAATRWGGSGPEPAIPCLRAPRSRRLRVSITCTADQCAGVATSGIAAARSWLADAPSMHTSTRGSLATAQDTSNHPQRRRS